MSSLTVNFDVLEASSRGEHDRNPDALMEEFLAASQ
jgi:hypothetical protein